MTANVLDLRAVLACKEEMQRCAEHSGFRGENEVLRTLSFIGAVVCFSLFVVALSMV